MLFVALQAAYDTLSFLSPLILYPPSLTRLGKTFLGSKDFNWRVINL